ncbi:hypothetical protein BB558_000117 [Smittium angustum]|uniref:MTHFR SAM-binding regulatory domain-containing protein n=1 Tax=Smittium angustum TaxID=133377 RepID=A0A2U1JF29_SMIAN|nr:hypothetical protein BB558_000117 [Smittium angustum]
MSLIERINFAISSNIPFFSLEFFPPKTPQGMLNLHDRIGRMKTWNPLFASVTWGAGGSTFRQSIDFAEMLKRDFDIEPEAKSKGIRTILALRGDEPVNNDYRDILIDNNSESETKPKHEFRYACDLVEYIRSVPEYSEYFCIGVAGNPEGYCKRFSTEKPETESVLTPEENLSLQEEEEMKWLLNKVNKGADFILTQVFYDTQKFTTWEQKCRKNGIKIPIIPTILPIQTYSSFIRIVNLTKIHVPTEINEKLDLVKNDDYKVKSVGVEICINQLDKLVEYGVPGFHFSTLNLELSTYKIILESGLLKKGAELAATGKIYPKDKTDISTNNKFQVESVTWDEYPNSRWGDARSPAFFSESSYGALAIAPRNELNTWGTPTSMRDINELFFRYIKGDIGSLPWTADNISVTDRKSLQILEKLCLNSIWTLASQSAIDGISSTDPDHGWGPDGGYVYQRSFIEFFVTDSIAEKIFASLQATKNKYTFYAAKVQQNINCGEDAEPKIISNAVNQDLTNVSVEESSSNDSYNKQQIESTALSWGVFPGSPVVQSALIDKLNFGFWSKEAINLWSVWANHLAGSNTQRSADFLESIKGSIWLINVIGNDYKKPNELFDTLEKIVNN